MHQNCEGGNEVKKLFCNGLVKIWWVVQLQKILIAEIKLRCTWSDLKKNFVIEQFSGGVVLLEPWCKINEAIWCRRENRDKY